MSTSLLGTLGRHRRRWQSEMGSFQQRSVEREKEVENQGYILKRGRMVISQPFKVQPYETAVFQPPSDSEFSQNHCPAPCRGFFNLPPPISHFTLACTPSAGTPPSLRKTCVWAVEIIDEKCQDMILFQIFLQYYGRKKQILILVCVLSFWDDSLLRLLCGVCAAMTKYSGIDE